MGVILELNSFCGVKMDELRSYNGNKMSTRHGQCGGGGGDGWWPTESQDIRFARCFFFVFSFQAAAFGNPP